MSTEIFKVGDPVFDIHFGWGKVSDILGASISSNVVVIFDSNLDEELYYEQSGAYYENMPTLSFTEYDLINGGWSQDRSVLNQPKKGDLVYVRDFKDDEWMMYFFSHKGDGGAFYCFQEQQKEGDTNSWRYMETENPLLKTDK